ncbi:hypothetical protein AB0O57_29655 [Streptomyces sp. NPDC091201]|uniref:hypothetical protein n=1 Tax=Streptomyces sp. NPDC091201 TaxID=3155190 RepID=UPI0034460B43
MSHIVRTLTLPGHDTWFAVTARPQGPAAGEYLPLPEGMTTDHITARSAGAVRPGDIVVGEFEADANIRATVYFSEPFAADPHQLYQCPCAGCEECREYDDLRHPEGYVCLRPSDDFEPCVIVGQGMMLAVVPAQVAAQFPPLTLPVAVDHVFVECPEAVHGPYEVLRVPRAWGPWDAVSISPETARQLAEEINVVSAATGLTAEWKADWLVIRWTARYRGMLSADLRSGRPGREVIEPDESGRYRISRLWRWGWQDPEEPAA